MESSSSSFRGGLAGQLRPLHLLGLVAITGAAMALTAIPLTAPWSTCDVNGPCWPQQIAVFAFGAQLLVLLVAIPVSAAKGWGAARKRWMGGPAGRVRIPTVALWTLLASLVHAAVLVIATAPLGACFGRLARMDLGSIVRCNAVFLAAAAISTFASVGRAVRA